MARGSRTPRSTAFLRQAAPAAAAALSLLPVSAKAHIKWFAPYDVTQAPQPLAEVLTLQFLLTFGGFALLVAGSFLLDRLVTKAWPRFSRPGDPDATETLLRAGTGAYFVALFAGGGVILTPELRTGAEWLPWLQFGIAVSMLSARSCAFGGIGILVLYGYGAAQYGAFHLADYPMFLGMAAYMVLTSCTSERARALRMPILYTSICATLMWGAIEKWAYPQWTFPLLAARPYLTLGIPADAFLVLAGFVEFAFAFYILTGLGMLRLGILGLGLIFTLAIIDFGRMDAIGHLPTIVAMAAMFLHGPTALHHAVHAGRRGPVGEASRAGGCFAAAIGIFFLAYYGMQHAEYGGGQDAVQRLATLPSSAAR
ncbi:hypothetical protein CKO45_24795 [Paracraurococcus ruber]|uniref:DoxX family protein n=2 Tax=Paracraurococcus ruber TaxID=77675 RepID=A0ABS1D4P4_9PROT|nr:hypothetical protein [Paracraurococcus ruber]